MIDVIVVGAGTAGCVLAERLTQSGALNVMLIEAGAEPSSPFVQIPAGFTRLFKGSHDWAFDSEPQSAAGGRRIFTPRRMLGGSSNLNAQIHQWCHPQDYADWVSAGATGWGWDDVAPVFLEQECFEGPDHQRVRGRAGVMTVTPNREAHPLSRAFVASARAAGFGQQEGYNGGAFEGAWIPEIAHRNGRRFSVYDACLRPARARPNLQIVSGAHVLRVDTEGGQVCGVRVRQDGTERVFRARAVVLAAGAFGSPQILMLSGIGPGAVLATLGIPVHVDAPDVGANLQDHPLAVTKYRTHGTDTLRKATSLPSLLRYLVFKRGMLASNGIEGIAFARSAPHLAAPDIELLIAPLEWRKEALEPPKIDAISIAAAVVAPRSRGRLWLASADPLAPPRIDFGVLSDPEGADRRALLAAMRLARRVVATAPLSGFIAEEIAPGAAAQTDDELFARACDELQTVYHPTSTCRMGCDQDSVVDPELRVRGIAGMWVADASVMPSVPRGHPNAAVAMIAHRAADKVIRDLAA
jgi:choline dehydrogenase